MSDRIKLTVDGLVVEVPPRWHEYTPAQQQAVYRLVEMTRKRVVDGLDRVVITRVTRRPQHPADIPQGWVAHGFYSTTDDPDTTTTTGKDT